jgi:two-component system response regulator FixJ
MTDGQIVHIVDDDTEVLASLAGVLLGAGYSCKTHPSGEAFLATKPEALTGCAIVDFRMPGMDGLAIVDELGRRGNRIPVILMTGSGDIPLAVRAMKAGATDFLEKRCPLTELTAAIDRALTISGRAHPVAKADAAARLARLTHREREVFDRLVLGDSNKAIANSLGISVRTVEDHRARIMERLEAKNLPDLVRLSLTIDNTS